MNKSVGERTIKLDGKEFLLRPDFKALEKIETLSGKGVMALMSTFADAGYLQAKDIVYTLFCCAESGGDERFNLDLKEFGQLVVSDGVYEHVLVATEMLSFVMTGGKKKAGEGQ